MTSNWQGVVLENVRVHARTCTAFGLPDLNFGLTGAAWLIAVQVNSKFTAKTFAETFTSIETTPDVLYPSLNFDAFDVRVRSALDKVAAATACTVVRWCVGTSGAQRADWTRLLGNTAASSQGEATAVDIPVPPSVKTVFLSINRFERKKNLQLALEVRKHLRALPGWKQPRAFHAAGGEGG